LISSSTNAHKHGARSTKQAIAIDLSPPKQGTAKAKTRKSAESAYERPRPAEGQAFREALARGVAGAEARGAFRGFQEVAVAAGAQRGRAPAAEERVID
jgi:hypothetical protein